MWYRIPASSPSVPAPDNSTSGSAALWTDQLERSAVCATWSSPEAGDSSQDEKTRSVASPRRVDARRAIACRMVSKSDIGESPERGRVNERGGPGRAAERDADQG